MSAPSGTAQNSRTNLGASEGGIPIAQRKRARDLLVQAMYQWALTGTQVVQIEAEFRADNSGKKIEWEFFNQAITTITDRVLEMDGFFLPHLDRDPSQLTPIEIGLLRLGVWELKERIETPYRVVINEYVELAKKFGATDSHKFVNGILDKAAKVLRQTEVNAKRS
jgi:N utilization substance protein B